MRALPVAQPFAHAYVSGQLTAAALWLPPPKEVVGTRIAIHATHWDDYWLWRFQERGLDLPHKWQAGMSGLLGHVGSVEVAGWLKVSIWEAKVEGQYRPKSETPFRKPKAINLGPIWWVFRKPRIDRSGLAFSQLSMLQAEYADQPHIIERDAAHRKEAKANETRIRESPQVRHPPVRVLLHVEPRA